jgi:hypothetical protein
MTDMPTDRRQFKRFETLLIVEIGPQQESTPYFFGITKDISFEGFIFESQNYDLQPGDIFEFRLKHPKNDLSVPVFGKIVWNRETKFECHSGVRFHVLDNETKGKMFTLISSDMTEGDRYASLVEEFRSTTEQNEKAAPDGEEREGMISDITGPAATCKNEILIDQGDMRSGGFAPVNSGKYRDDRDAQPDEMSGAGKSVTIDNQRPHTQKKEGKSIRENKSRASAGPVSARRNGHRKRTSYALSAAVFSALIIVTALILFVPNTIREKIIPPSFSNMFIEITDSMNSGGGAPVPRETDVSEPPPALIGQSESLPEDTERTAEDRALAGAGVQMERNGHEESSDHDSIVADARSKDLPVAERATGGEGVIGPSPEANAVSDSTAVSTEVQLARAVEEKGVGHITLKDSGDTNMHKSEAAGNGEEKEEVRQNGTIDRKELKPVTKAGKTGKTGEKIDQPVNKKRAKRSPGQEKVNTVSSKKTDALSETVQEKSGVQEDVTLQKPDGESGNAPEKRKTAVTHHREKTEAVQMEVNASGSRDGDGGRIIEHMKEPEPGVRNDAVVKKMAGSVKQGTAEKFTDGKADPEAVIGKRGERIQISEEKPAATGSELKTRDVEDLPSGDRSKKSAGTEGTPRIALVVRHNPENVPAVKEKAPEITDEYLKKYFTAYMDPFDDNSNKWDVFDIGAASSRIEEGFYHIENKKQGGALIVLHYYRFPHESDFVIETAIRAISGTDGNSFGLIFGAKDARNNYSFQVRENKYYALKTYRRGVSKQVTAGKISDLYGNNNASVLLKIVKQADGIYFYINNRYVDKASNLKFYGDRVGFIVEGKSHIAIDYTRSYVRKADSGRTD